MSIIRAPRPEGNFYVLNKAISEDARLTWAARGLLVYLLGKPDNWKISPAHLRGETAETVKPTGRDGIYGLLDELIKAGYVQRFQVRADGGVLGEVSYLVSESPLPASPYPVRPHPAAPLPAETTLTSTEYKQGLKEQASTDLSNGTDVPATADQVAERFAQFWSKYPKKVQRKDALKAWMKLKPSAELFAQIMTALGSQMASHDWLKESGRYIPNGATWINGERWLDEVSSGGTGSRRSGLGDLPQHTADQYGEGDQW